MLIKIAGAALAGLLVVASASMAEEAHQLSRGQTVYVPVYSEVLHGNLDSSGNPSRMPLSASASSVRRSKRLAQRRQDLRRLLSYREVRLDERATDPAFHVDHVGRGNR